MVMNDSVCLILVVDIFFGLCVDMGICLGLIVKV